MSETRSQRRRDGTDRDIALLEFYQREAHRLDAQMRLNLAVMYQYATAAFGLTFAAVGFLVAHKEYAVLLVVPLLLIVLWILVARVLAEVSVLVAVHLEVERHVRSLLAERFDDPNFVVWEETAGAVVKASAPNVLAFGVLAIATIAVGVASLVVAWQRPRAVPHGLAVGDAWLCAALAAAALASMLVAHIDLPGRTHRRVAKVSDDNRDG